jgi:hypothetical protein
VIPGTSDVANFSKEGEPIYSGATEFDWEQQRRNPDKSRYDCTKCKKGFDKPILVESNDDGDTEEETLGRTIELSAVSASELATILHGLRIIQEKKNGPADYATAMCNHFDDAEQLSNAQIDALCLRLNPVRVAST